MVPLLAFKAECHPAISRGSVFLSWFLKPDGCRLHRLPVAVHVAPFAAQLQAGDALLDDQGC